jgi:hypothetical protein
MTETQRPGVENCVGDYPLRLAPIICQTRTLVAGNFSLLPSLTIFFEDLPAINDGAFDQ